MSDKDKQPPPFHIYVLLVIGNIITALVFGVLTNKIINMGFEAMGIDNIYAKVAVQIVFISIVIYCVKTIARYIKQEPPDTYSVDVIFLSVYLSSQENIKLLLDKIKSDLIS